LLDAGIDSFDVVVFVHWLRETLNERGALISSDEIDTKLLGAVTIRQISQISALLEIDRDAAVEEMRRFLDEQYAGHLRQDQQMMLADRVLGVGPKAAESGRAFGPAKSILLTGGTGFLGPFLLASLMRQTDAKVHVLVRARDEAEAANRIRNCLTTAIGERAESLEIADRVVLHCGDLEQADLGLGRDVWERLADDVDTIYHNGASVNYLLDYRRMRQANVFGVGEMLKLAFAGRPKQFDHISTTFIYGWGKKDVLFENDSNDEMALLDFGYSQSKWVSEQLVLDAGRKGLAVRVFRPSLITPSIDGGGETMDITLRFLSFIIKHGISVNARNQVSFVPADVAARNIVAIANNPASIGGVFNVTRDNYENLVDVTELITAKTGRRFDLFSIKEFVPEVIRRCTTEDPLYPLLDFLIDSADKIDAMADKRYDNDAYRAIRSANPDALADPPLSDVVDGILRFFGKRAQE
jgi:thioester reductase-like protein